MPTYIYKALTEEGKTVVGEIASSSDKELANELLNRGLLLQNVKRKRSVSRNILVRAAVNTEHFLLFNQELIALLGAGLTVTAALALVKDRDGQPKFSNVLHQILGDIENGQSLSEACARFPEVFDPLYITSVKTGERSGNIVAPLKRYLEFLRKKIALQRKLSNAMTYPLFLLIALAVIVSVLFVFVMPRFVTMYAGLDAELPLPTQMLLNIIDSLPIYAPIALLVVISGWLIFYSYKTSEHGRYRYDYLKTRLPIFGDVIGMYLNANMARTLSTLLSSGSTMVESLASTIEAIDNEWYKRRLKTVRNSVLEGRSLSASLESEKAFPKTGIKMIEAGEASGKLDDILVDIAGYFEETLDYKINRLTSLFEPLMMLVIGTFVGGIIVVMYLPIFSIASVIK